MIRTGDPGAVQTQVLLIAILELKGEIRLPFKRNRDRMKAPYAQTGITAQTRHPSQVVPKVPDVSRCQSRARIEGVLIPAPALQDQVVVVRGLEAGRRGVSLQDFDQVRRQRQGTERIGTVEEIRTEPCSPDGLDTSDRDFPPLPSSGSGRRNLRADEHKQRHPQEGCESRSEVHYLKCTK